nr:inactive lrr receptor-like serine/threonine-protein kinase bir2 [Quercus suber]
MVLNARALVLFNILVWSLPGTFSLSSGSLSDISCLKSITDSLEDPLKIITPSWTFDNLTEGSICGYVGVTCWNTFGRVRGLELANKGPVPDFVSMDTITPESFVNNSGLCGVPLDDSHYTYYFNLWVISKKRNKIMPTETAVLKECRKNMDKQVDQVNPLPTKGLHQEEIILVSELERMVCRVNLTELSEATGNFKFSTQAM